MDKFSIATVVLACVLTVCVGQTLSFGRCPTVKVQQQFDINQYMGKWFEERRFFAIFEAGMTCVSAEYTLQDDGSVKVNNTGYRWLTGKYSSAIGDAIVEDPKEPAKLGVRFSPSQPRGDYWVLETDYSQYTVIWSCTQLSRFLNTQFAWVLTRSPEGVSAPTMSRIYDLLKGYGINTKNFSTTEQDRSKCPGR
ncbi:apolipoprotein D-like isoform X2 [Dreissena polymorpha]|uniref:apolipoprotein D-like isoform X2 n=1 Tax=Dreissena polymorpha TaxID=45954 RepID=UPI0022647FC3|nr:apolipoprotein D-like isoform X2 [Dreissena polymorpha]